VDIYNESHGEDSNADSHQPGLWTGPEDPKLAWLSDARIIGEVSDDHEEGQSKLVARTHFNVTNSGNQFRNIP
jgi:hypothetical protein